jgi:Uma2 family endonuclease
VTVDVAAHIGPWTEDDLRALPDGMQRYELVDGILLVSPSPGGRHQRVSFSITALLDIATPAGLVAVQTLGVRLPHGSVLIPDVLVGQRDAVLANRSGILDPAAVLLAVEIVSPSSRTADRVTKPAIYAAGGIASYWRVEPDDGPLVATYRLVRGRYQHAGSGRPGQPVTVDRPFPLTFDPAQLIA